MAFYLIGYDLKRPGQNCGAVERAILRLDESAEKVLRSQWVVNVDEKIDVSTIRRRVWRAMDNNDRLLVIGLDRVDLEAWNPISSNYLELLE